MNTIKLLFAALTLLAIGSCWDAQGLRQSHPMFLTTSAARSIKQDSRTSPSRKIATRV